MSRLGAFHAKREKQRARYADHFTLYKEETKEKLDPEIIYISNS